MSERMLDPRLKELYDKGINVYSFSKLSSINECLYDAYLSYIKKIRGKDSCYTLAGTATHDCLEAIMNDEATVDDLLPTIDSTLEELELLGLPFPLDMKGNDTIKNSWVTNMTYFCKNYKKPKGNFETETFFLYKTDKGNYVQGYLDLTQIHNDGSISIYDYKTSSMFKGEDLPHKARQLVIYALAKEQEGKKVRRVAWIMLKYSKVTFVGKKSVRSKNETELTKVIENKNIVKELEKHIKDKLLKLGKEEFEIEIILDQAKKNNTIPEELVGEFKIVPYVMEYEITDEVKKECIEWIDNTVEMWESKNPDNELFYSPRSFTRVQKNGRKVEDTFFCVSLCGHRECCEYIKDYNRTREVKKNKFDKEDDDDLFG